ncbi:hypothetical protein ACHY84_001503 [Enterococcus faecalis]
MRDFSLLDSAIDEMERVLLGNKPRVAEEIYLQNAIDFTERFIKQFIEESKLNKKQEYLLRELICQFDTLDSPPTPFQAVYWLMHDRAWNGASDLHKAITSLDNKQQAQVLRAFADWIEQEEK